MALKFESFPVGKPLESRKSNTEVDLMEASYDFSKGERGKFFRDDAHLNIPIYLDNEVQSFVEEIARKKNSDVESVVNDLLRGDMRIAEIVR